MYIGLLGGNGFIGKSLNRWFIKNKQFNQIYIIGNNSIQLYYRHGESYQCESIDYNQRRKILSTVNVLLTSPQSLASVLSYAKQFQT